MTTNMERTLFHLFISVYPRRRDISGYKISDINFSRTLSSDMKNNQFILSPVSTNMGEGLDAMCLERRVAAIGRSTYEVIRGTQVRFLCRRNQPFDI
jgi:hypothetical protein